VHRKYLSITDGGATWNEQNSGTTQWLASQYFINADTGWVTGDSGTILKTVDGGANWLAQNYGTIFSINSVHFANTDIGWALRSDYAVLKTVDGGLTWALQTNTSAGFSFIDFVDVNTAYSFVGAGNAYSLNNFGKIMKTIDGGDNWDTLAYWPSQDLASVYFTDSNTGFTV